MKTIQQQRGFTLLEILVAVTVLSVGLLGLAGLQTLSLKNNNSAYMRSQATYLAYDLADRVRANNNTNYINAMGSASLHNGNCEVTTPGCSATEMAEYDMAVWQDQLEEILPGGEGIICRDGDGAITDGTGVGDTGCSGSGSNYTIKIWWDDKRDGSAKQLFAWSFQP